MAPKVLPAAIAIWHQASPAEEVTLSTEPFHVAVKRLRMQRDLSQRQLARLAYLNSGHLSKIENGLRRPSIRLAEALDTALDAGGDLIAIAYAERGKQPTIPSDAMRRRTVVRWGVTATAAAGVARALTAYSFLGIGPDAQQVPTVAQLVAATASAKRHYQACRYVTALAELPSLLTQVQRAIAAAAPDDLFTVYRLAADAYQVTGSLMLKLGDHGLATLAADRSIDAASRSQDPIALAASARIITHTLMSTGHPGRAVDIATRAAEQLDADLRIPSGDAISVYGALVLRGAIAAARHEDRTGAATLLDEADQAARRFGRDDNAYWTAFGPTNVLLHRVNVALLLGDAGTAIDLAGRIDLAAIELPERQAALLLDVAEAYHQWGKHDRAYDALVQAEHIAPEEVRTREAVHHLVADLVHRAPRNVQLKAVDFGDLIGAEI